MAKSNSNELLDAFMGIPAEKEYYLTEWTSDHARQGWWKESDILEEHGISRSSKNKNDWHCDIKYERIHSNAYDEDWNLLMDVYSKLQCLPSKGDISYPETGPLGIYTNIQYHIPDIRKTHYAIVEFIKWYAGKDPTILAQV